MIGFDATALSVCSYSSSSFHIHILLIAIRTAEMNHCNRVILLMRLSFFFLRSLYSIRVRIHDRNVIQVTNLLYLHNIYVIYIKLYYRFVNFSVWKTNERHSSPFQLQKYQMNIIIKKKALLSSTILCSFVLKWENSFSLLKNVNHIKMPCGK